jgi:hypothetical protein
VTNVPTEVVKSRLQLGRNPHNATGGWLKYTSNYTGTAHAVSSIVRSEGVRGLYAGFTACLAVEACYAGFSFAFYEALKKQHFQHYYHCRSHQYRDDSTSCTIDNNGAAIIRPFEAVAMGAIAGVGASILTNPLDVITLRLMTQGKRKHYRGMVDCLQKSLSNEGVQVLWKGSGSRMMSTIPSTAISLGVYETIKVHFFQDAMDSS